jgi:hypothetical protein
MWKVLRFSFALGMLAIALPANANAASCPESSKGCYISSYCNQANALCGAIAYINKGGYVVNPTRLEAVSSQPNAPINPKCSGVKFKEDNDMALGQYVTFIVPANCGLRLRIDIVAGKNKDRKLFLTPGCVIKASTAGTTLSNSWSIDVSWSDQAKQAGKSGTVQDQAGNKCGNLEQM